MGKAKKVYKDKAGNVLYKRYIKTRKRWQYFAKNKEGRLVNLSGVRKLMNKKGMSLKKMRR